MRLPSAFARLTHRTATAIATEVAEAVRTTAEATLAEVVEAVRAEVTAPMTSTTRHRGRTAATVVAVTATAIVATAAYVWWKRRDQIEPEIAEVEYPNETPAARRPAPTASTVPVAATVTRTEVAHAYAEPSAQATLSGSAPLVRDDCGATSEGPKPSVAAANPSAVRPPVASGRFAMPGVRRLVLPTAARFLP